MRSLADSRYDPIIWCGCCFIVSFVAFWVPPMLTDAPGGSVIWLFTSPFILGASFKALLSCWSLIAKRNKNGQKHLSNAMIVLAVVFTIGTISPILLFLVGIF